MIDELVTCTIWNACLTAVLAAAVGGVIRVPGVRRRPVLMHALWLLVLLKLIAPPLVPLPVIPASLANLTAGSPARGFAQHVPRGTASGEERPGVDSGQNGESLAVLDSHVWLPGKMPFAMLAVIASVAGTLLVLAAAWLDMRRIDRALHGGGPCDFRLRRVVRLCSRRMGLAKCPDARVVAANVSPLLWVGRRGPRIVVPRAF